MYKTEQTLVEAFTGKMQDFADALQDKIDELEDQQAERESEARGERIGALQDLLDLVAAARVAAEDLGTAIEGFGE